MRYSTFDFGFFIFTIPLPNTSLNKCHRGIIIIEERSTNSKKRTPLAQLVVIEHIGTAIDIILLSNNNYQCQKIIKAL